MIPVNKYLMRIWLIVMLLFINIGILIPMATAKEPVTPQLSLNQAVALALANDNSVEKATIEIDRTQELRDSAGGKIIYIPTGPVNDGNAVSAYTSALNAELTYQKSMKDLTAAQEAVIYNTCSNYWDLVNAQQKLKIAKMGLDKVSQDLQKARISFQVGVASKIELTNAETQLKSSQASYASAQNNLDTAYSVFNKSIGLWSEDRPILTEDLEFKPLKITDLSAEITSRIEQNPNIWYAETAANMMKSLEEQGLNVGSGIPGDARQAGVQQTLLDVATGKQTAEQAVESLYYKIRSLEENYAAAQQGLLLLEDNLKVQQIKTDIGMGTKNELLAVELEIASARQALAELNYQHHLAILAFEKPWAVNRN